MSKECIIFNCESRPDYYFLNHHSPDVWSIEGVCEQHVFLVGTKIYRWLILATVALYLLKVKITLRHTYYAFKRFVNHV